MVVDVIWVGLRRLQRKPFLGYFFGPYSSAPSSPFEALRLTRPPAPQTLDNRCPSPKSMKSSVPATPASSNLPVSTSVPLPGPSAAPRDTPAASSSSASCTGSIAFKLQVASIQDSTISTGERCTFYRPTKQVSEIDMSKLGSREPALTPSKNMSKIGEIEEENSSEEESDELSIERNNSWTSASITGSKQLSASCDPLSVDDSSGSLDLGTQIYEEVRESPTLIQKIIDGGACQPSLSMHNLTDLYVRNHGPRTWLSQPVAVATDVKSKKAQGFMDLVRLVAKKECRLSLYLAETETRGGTGLLGYMGRLELARLTARQLTSYIAQRIAITARCIVSGPMEAEVFDSLLGMISVADGTSSGNALVSYLRNIGISINHCRGLSFDGYSGMRRHYDDIIDKIQAIQPLASFVHSATHPMSTVLSDSALVHIEVSLFFGTIRRLFDHFTANGKRWNTLECCLAGSEIEERCSNGRWETLFEAIDAIMVSYDELISLLHRTAADNRCTQDERVDLTVVKNQMKRFIFLVLLQVWRSVIQKAKVVTKMLQKDECLLSKASVVLGSLVEDLKEMKSTFLCYVNKAKAFAESHSLPTEWSTDGAICSQKAFEAEIFSPMMENMISQVEARYDSVTKTHILFDFLNPIGLVEAQENDIKNNVANISIVYRADLKEQALLSELLSFRIAFHEELLTMKSPKEILDLLPTQISSATLEKTHQIRSAALLGDSELAIIAAEASLAEIVDFKPVIDTLIDTIGRCSKSQYDERRYNNGRHCVGKITISSLTSAGASPASIVLDGGNIVAAWTMMAIARGTQCRVDTLNRPATIFKWATAKNLLLYEKTARFLRYQRKVFNDVPFLFKIVKMVNI
ncbi:hypothetical protein BIW11_03462 [Tropilaelaps mercedesae]|uniref:Uncharacterized protein n=1 Tax=Tropilaelaps mercedesae TaxID=418985 RepID=A0A1V9XLB0_9ACAR|nr:hypothetical protein BIW11_03462 [Tropilaelaps mercedesae]